jgi:formylglycine-generating enzyme required for sulfatase activity
VGPIAATVIPKTTIRAIAAAPYCVPSAEAGAAYSLLFDMVSVAGGTYSMGGSTGWFYDGQPIHTVTVSSFMIGTYEVTQAQYAAVAGINPSSFTGDARPVDTVTWYDALEFCNKLSESEGLQNVYTITGRTPASGYPITGAAVAVDWTKNGYRLPTEAEWEWAARGGQSSLGYLYAGSNTPGDVAWYLANLSDASHPVGTKAANELELYDMSGNVWEFCWDWYYSTYPSGPETDPTGPASGTQRVIRGGCWSTDIYDIAVSTRGMCVPDSGGNLVGFRAARSGQ